MGFDLTRFQGEVDEELLCPICSEVLEDPLQVIMHILQILLQTAHQYIEYTGICHFHCSHSQNILGNMYVGLGVLA